MNTNKEIKVKLYRNEDDNYVELWQVVEHKQGTPKYYGRYTYGTEGTWYYICDPLGYCELDYPVKDDVVFILCDDNNNEVLRYSNADKNPLPKFNLFMKQKWNEFSKDLTYNRENFEVDFWSLAYNGETTLSINQWLLTYMDPDLYKKEIDEMSGYDINWTSPLYSSEIKYESIPGTEFEYLGHKYQFTKVFNKHNICGAEWTEFICTDSPYVVEKSPFNKNKNYIKNYGYLGNIFDASQTGTMFDKRTAKLLVEKELLKLFPQKIRGASRLFIIEGIYCYEKTYNNVAEMLISNDYHKTKISALIENLKEITKDIVFASSYQNAQIIKEKYPDVYGYNHCLF